MGSDPICGFALMEVLIAVVVITMGVVGVVGVCQTALEALQAAGERVQAVNRLEGELAALRARAEMANGLTPNRWAGSWPEWPAAAWQAEAVEETPRLMAVTLRADWSRSGRARSVEVTTKIRGPGSEG